MPLPGAKEPAQNKIARLPKRARTFHPSTHSFPIQIICLRIFAENYRCAPIILVVCLLLLNQNEWAALSVHLMTEQQMITRRPPDTVILKRSSVGEIK